MRLMIICNLFALMLCAFSAIMVSQAVEGIISVEATSGGVPAWSQSDLLTTVVHSQRRGVIGEIQNYPVYVLAGGILMNIGFWLRHRNKQESE